MGSKSSGKMGQQFRIKPYDVHLVGSEIYIQQETKKRDGSQEETKGGQKQRENQDQFSS
jgi:hypothetical protein